MRRLYWLAAALGVLILGGVVYTRLNPWHRLWDRTLSGAARSDFAGSSSCRSCHERFYQLWATSHHGLALQPFTAVLARKALQAAPIDIAAGGFRYRFAPLPDGGEVREISGTGERSYPIEHVMGGKNVFYFLTPLERGRLQVLPLAYDVRRRRWFETSESAMRHFEDVPEMRVDWRDPLYTFNTSCYGCHVSQLSTNYDPGTDTYRTVWSEPGINCETCHGPSAEHVSVCRKLAPGQKPHDLKIIVTSKFTPEQHNSSCASCHAKMSMITNSFHPGDRFFDHFDLVTLENPDFYPDGRDLGENYTYTHWRMNPCAAKSNLHCVHCHTSSGRYRFAGDKANDACLPCHELRVRNAPAHSRHKAGGEGNKCVSCHMPQTEFANMIRSDHSFRPPAPGATLEFKSPNACNICHKERDAAWADRHVRRWHKEDYQARILRPARLVAAARRQDWKRLPEMLSYIVERDRDEVSATSLIRLLEHCEDDRKWPVLTAALKDVSPLMRSAAANALGGLLTEPAVLALAAAARDEVRLVRLRAAGALAAYPLDRLGEADRRGVEAAFAELEASFTSRPDDWSSHYNLGNYYAERQDFRRAIEAFRASARLRPDVVMPLVNAAMAHARLGESAEAEKSLARALQLEPSNATANFNMGLLKAEMGEIARAEECLRMALKSDPRMAQAAYNLAIILAQSRLPEAIEWCRKANALRPAEPKYSYTLAFYLLESGRMNESVSLLRGMTTSHPAYIDAYTLLVSIYERRGETEKAKSVLRQAVQVAGIQPGDREQLRARLQSMR